MVKTKKKDLDLDNVKMAKECGCKDCLDKDNCNGVDLMNCYIIKRLNINKVEAFEKERKRGRGD